MSSFNYNQTFEGCLERHYKWLQENDIQSKQVKVAVPRNFDIEPINENSSGRVSHLAQEQLLTYITYYNQLYRKFNIDKSYKLDYIVVSTNLYEYLCYYNLVMEEQDE